MGETPFIPLFCCHLHDDVAERIVAQPADCGGCICSADLAASGTVPVLTDAAPTRSDAATSRQAPPTVIPRSSQHQLTDTREQPPLFEDRHPRRRRRRSEERRGGKKGVRTGRTW